MSFGWSCDEFLCNNPFNCPSSSSSSLVPSNTRADVAPIGLETIFGYPCGDGMLVGHTVESIMGIGWDETNDGGCEMS